MKVTALANEFYMHSLYQYMFKNKLESCIDTTDTVWYLDQVEEILMTKYNYERHA